MRLKTVSIQNFRLIADSTIEIPTGLTLVNGENGLGKSSIFQAILWCLYGPDALGDNQTSLVRQGHRDLTVTVVMKVDPGPTSFTVTRTFSLNPNGKAGRTELHVELGSGKYAGDLSGGTVAEAQDVIIKNIGARDIFMATAYVDQHDGPGAFLRSKPAEQRQQLRELLNISDDWDTWHDLAKLKKRTVIDRNLNNLGRVVAAQEFIDANAGIPAELRVHQDLVNTLSELVRALNLNLEDLQDAQDEVDKVVAENERRTKALTENQTSLDMAIKVQEQSSYNKNVLTKRVENLPALDEERTDWLGRCDFWDDRNTEYVAASRAHIDRTDRWNKRQATDERRVELSKVIADTDIALRNQPPHTHCPTCEQKLATEKARVNANKSRMAVELQQEERVKEINSLGPIPAQVDSRPTQPVSPGTRPVFESETEWNAAKSAESDIAAVDAEIKTRAEQVNTLSLAREELPTPDDYDLEAYTARAQTIGKVNAEIEQAQTDKRGREQKLAAAEYALELIEKRKAEITGLNTAIELDQKLQKDLEIVVTGTGPSGARQLMIDQQLGDFQAEVNQWLGILLPGFSIYMDTQAESGRESFTTAFATPTGVIGWNGLSGAQRVGVGLSTRLALASMVQQRQGHTFETWMLDEVDGSMRGEKREAFVAMLFKLQQQGIDLLVVSHADTVVERMEQRIEVIDAGGFTEVK